MDNYQNCSHLHQKNLFSSSEAIVKPWIQIFHKNGPNKRFSFYYFLSYPLNFNKDILTMKKSISDSKKCLVNITNEFAYYRVDHILGSFNQRISCIQPKMVCLDTI